MWGSTEATSEAAGIVAVPVGVSCCRFLLVAEDAVELDDGLVLLEGEAAALDVRAEVVGPPQPAALPAPRQPCHKINYFEVKQPAAYDERDRSGKEKRTVTGILGEGAPVALPVLVDVGDEPLVLLRRPRPFLQPGLVTARRAPHLGALDPRTQPGRIHRAESKREKDPQL
jgi:hypothetical protein